MKILTIALIVFFSYFLFTDLKRKIYAKQMQNKLVELLNRRKYLSLENQLNECEDKGYITKYNANFLRMNSAILQNDFSALNHVLLIFDSMKLTNLQSCAVYSNIMIFALEKQNKELCKKAYSRIMLLKKNEELKDTATLVYRVCVLKDSLVKNEIQRRMANASTEKKELLTKLQKLL